jgi:hypothetical protein
MFARIVPEQAGFIEHYAGEGYKSPLPDLMDMHLREIESPLARSFEAQ